MNEYKKINSLNETEEKEIRELLVGRKIIEVKNNNTFILDNEMRLLVNPNSGCCCGAGDYAIKHISKANNAITNVEFVRDDYEEKHEYFTSYKIFVIADGLQTEILDVYGTDGNGYYGTGYEVQVYVPTREMQELKSCPFCGCEDIEFEHLYNNYQWVCCPECKCNTGGYKTDEEAIKAWNRRV